MPLSRRLWSLVHGRWLMLASDWLRELSYARLGMRRPHSALLLIIKVMTSIDLSSLDYMAFCSCILVVSRAHHDKSPDYETWPSMVLTWSSIQLGCTSLRTADRTGSVTSTVAAVFVSVHASKLQTNIFSHLEIVVDYITCIAFCARYSQLIVS